MHNLRHFLLQIDSARHLLNCHHDPTSRTQWLHSEIDEVLFGEGREHCHVDLAVNEVLNVVVLAQVGKQSFDVVVLRQLITLTNRGCVEKGRGHVVEQTGLAGLSFNPGAAVTGSFERSRRCA